MDQEPILVGEALTLICKSFLQKIESPDCVEQLCNLIEVISLRCKFTPIIYLNLDNNGGKFEIKQQYDPEGY